MNSKLKPIQCGKAYSIRGTLVKAVRIFSFGIGLLNGVRTIKFESENGVRFKATQWHDGSIYRITRYE